MNDAAIKQMGGLSRFKLTPEEARSALWRRFAQAIEEELAIKRLSNDHPISIQDTTVLRGEIALLKRIVARTDEVGPQSRTSEGNAPESSPALSAERFTVS